MKHKRIKRLKRLARCFIQNRVMPIIHRWETQNRVNQIYKQQIKLAKLRKNG